MFIMTSRPRTRVFRPCLIWGCERLVSIAKVIENQVMASPIISIWSDSFEECVGSHVPRVILFDVIPAIIPVIPEVPIVSADPIVTPEVGTVSVISPAGVLDLVDYSCSSDSDPSKDSLPPAPDCHCEAFRRWRSAPLSTPYPPTTSELSLGSSSERSLDSSSPSFRPSHKRCRSPTTSVPSPTHDSRSIAPTPADLLPPHKRGVADVVREGYEDFEVRASAADTREITEEFRQVRRDRDDTRRRLRRLESYVGGHGFFSP
ncbi:hypothetical protein Tco_1156447 [Tanacetum coccineum]